MITLILTKENDFFYHIIFVALGQAWKFTETFTRNFARKNYSQALRFPRVMAGEAD
jgi:hypothetical protein